MGSLALLLMGRLLSVVRLVVAPIRFLTRTTVRPVSTSPRQNRVDPWGELFADRSRGSLMGNRGLLHDDQGRIKKNHQLERWIICLLEFKGWRREVMKPGHYTELFFWDEATALAAGHRPCAECQRARYELFRDAWMAGQETTSRVLAPELDAVLHSERIANDGSKVTFQAYPGDLPNGTMVARDSEPDGPRAYLVHGGRLWRWTSNGYEEPSEPLGSEAVAVLTPRSTVAALENGFDAAVRLPDGA